MKQIIYLITFFCFNINCFAQKLTAEETIKVLQTAKQSVEIIDFVVQNNFTFTEIYQANQLKSKGLKDEIIIYALQTHAILTESEINDLFSYQQQGLPLSVINKTIDEKPKSIENNKEKAKKYPQKTNYTIEDKSPLEKDTVKYHEIIGVDLNKEKIIEGLKKWCEKYKSKKSIIEAITDTTISTVGIFFLNPKYDAAKDLNANEPKVKFNISVTSSNGYYNYKISDFIVSYYYGREPSTMIERPIEKMVLSPVRKSFKNETHTKVVQMINDINTFVVQ